MATRTIPRRFSRRLAPADDEQALLARAADLTVPGWQLTGLPLWHLPVWAALAARPADAPGARDLRAALVGAAKAGPLNFSGCPGANSDERTPAWAHVVLATPWLGPRVLAELTGEAAMFAPDTSALVPILLAHPKVTFVAVAPLLRYTHAGRDSALALLEAAGGRWALYARLDRVREVWQPAAQEDQYVARSPGRFAAVVAPLPDLVLDVLVRMLPTWTATLDEAVHVARNVVGECDPVPFHDTPVGEERAQAVRLARDPGTCAAQLRLLPLRDFSVWTAVAAHPNLDADVRRLLVDVAAGERLFAVPAGVDVPVALLTPAWLTPHRRARIADVRAAGTRDVPALVAAVSVGSAPLRATLATLAAFTQHSRREAFTAALAALAEGSHTQAALARIAAALSPYRPREDSRPGWRGDLRLSTLVAVLGDVPAQHLPALADVLETERGDRTAVRAALRARGVPLPPCACCGCAADVAAAVS